ncbi:MAG: hypothetical protein C0397_16475 [Odoribacter sp.]|nr:hypothetical protein [Odoribacter sp.]
MTAKYIAQLMIIALSFAVRHMNEMAKYIAQLMIIALSFAVDFTDCLKSLYPLPFGFSQR